MSFSYVLLVIHRLSMPFVSFVLLHNRGVLIFLLKDGFTLSVSLVSGQLSLSFS